MLRALLTHVAGVDVHKEVLVITALIGLADAEPVSQTFSCQTFTQDLHAAGKKLIDLGIKHVVMESTGIYWKPVYNVWHPLGIKITLANAFHVKKVPGRKTDVTDSQWLAELHRFGMVSSSFIPDAEFQTLRLLNRHRSNLVEDLSRVKNRVQKILEDGNVKFGSIVSDVFGQAGIALLDAISKGITDTTSLSNLLQNSRLKRKDQLSKSLSNCLRTDHVFLIQQLMLQFTDIQNRIAEVEKELEERLASHADLLERLDEIPGIDKITARGIIAEASDNLASFPNDRAFAAWAGVAPGNNESAGKKKELPPEKGTQP